MWAHKHGKGSVVAEQVTEKTTALMWLISLQHCFAIMYRRDNQRQYEMRAASASECQAWIESIKMAR